ncbi:MAG: InlB B-repeat-containing protein [Bacilli bacterium]|nr:InlB B-repeat-containing protein [Bacilli bacterium]
MRKNKAFLLFFLFLSIFIYTVAYSGLATELSITSNVKFRPIVDIRIENIQLYGEPTGGAMIKYEPNLWEPDWNVAQTITGFTLPNSDSSITYQVTVKNYGDVDQCIYSTSMDDQTVNYQITGYTIKDIIGAGQTATFYLTFTPITTSEEERNIIVHYEFRRVFTVAYDANGGTGAPAAQRKYEREDLTLSSTVPTWTGHQFLGWSTNSSDNSVQYQPGGTFTTDAYYTTLYAKWKLSKVQLKMDMNGGTLSGNKGSNVSYDGTLVTVDNSDIIHELNYGSSLPQGGLMDYNDPQNINIERTGYQAVSGAEWKTTIDNNVVTFDQSASYASTAFTNTYDQDTVVTLQVNWEPITYSITYDLNGGSLPSGVTNPTSYNIETPDFTLNNPSKEGSVFLGWREDSLETPTTTKTISTGTTGNKTITAVFEDVEAPTISHAPTTWTNQDVTATITSSHNDYTYMYKIDDGSYLPYNSSLTIGQNCTITAYSLDGANPSLETTHIISNIDKINPTLSSLSSDNVLTDGFDISGTAQDQESGLTELRIYIKKDSEPDYTYVTSINYSTDVNAQKSFSYTFTGLDDNTDYVAKVVAVDLAGNLSTASEVNVTTTEEIIIVARLIGYNGSDYDCEENPSLCKTFSTLKSAIEYTGNVNESDNRNCLLNQCTIQMLDSVAESNTILQGQDITLDLNGYTINGVRDYTFTNNGEFTVIDSDIYIGEAADFNELSENCIKNTTGTAIVNNGTLNLGEYNTAEYVSVYEPYIYGGSTGISTTNGTFNFYDGRIRATTAISGRVEDRPPMYDANVQIIEESGVSHQVATLSILSDAEARIDNKYYTRVALAVDDAKPAPYIDVLESDDFQNSFAQDPLYQYGFIKSGNYLVNENTTSSTIAGATFVLDLRDASADQVLEASFIRTRNVNSTSEFGGHYFMISQYSEDGSSYNEQFTIPVGDSVQLAYLPCGSRYNVTLYHEINYDSYPEDNKMYLTSLTLRDSEYISPAEYDNVTVTDVSTNYTFEYDSDTKTFKSNNQYTSNTTAFGYYEIDLTNSAVDKKLIVNATLSAYGSHYGIVDVKTNNEMDTSNYYNALLSIYATSTPLNYGPMTATKTLTAGNKYYVQFYYVKQSDSYTKAAYDSMGVSDQFIINSLDIVDADPGSTTLPLSSMLQTPGTYGFTQNTWVYPNSSEVTHSYIPLNLTNTTTDMYLEIDFNSYYDFMIINTDTPALPADLSSPDYRNPTPTSSYTYYGPITINLRKGEMNYIHFIMPASSSGGTNLISVTMKQGVSYTITNSFNSSKQASASFNEFRYSDPIGIRNNTTSSPADSYVEIDLRNIPTDVVLSVDQILPSDGYAYMYLSDSPKAMNYGDVTNPASTKVKDMLMKFTYTGSMYRNGDYTSNLTYYTRTYDFVVSRGMKYYLHFGNYKTNSYYYYTINKIVTRPVNAYDTKVGKQRYISVPQSGGESELPEGMVIDENNENNLRYISSNPDNYVSFNGELWRIVGVFNTTDANNVTKPRIKIVRNDFIGAYSWDTSSNSVNGGSGVNEWSESDIMKLLNPGYDNESANNSLYWNSSSGYCYNGANDATTSCSFTSTGLNATAKSMIDEVVWYTGALNSAFNGMSAYDMYQEERGSYTGKDGITTSDISTLDNVTRTTSWLGKVGLIYPSDYYMAADTGNNIPRSQCVGDLYNYFGACSSNDWLYWSQMPYYSITPTNGGIYGNPTSPHYVIGFTGPQPYNTAAVAPFYIKPTVYLSTNIEITGGKGTSGQPYTLSLGSTDNENINNYYGLVPSGEPEDIGEVIDYSTTDYLNMRHPTVYGFEFDSTSKYYISNNASAGVSTALSYIVADRTSELTDTTIKITYDLSSYSGSGYVIIVPNNPDPNINPENYSSFSQYQNFSANSTLQTDLVTLEAGKKYYIYFAFKKYTSDTPTDTYRENMRVKIDGLEDTTPTTVVTRYIGRAKNGIEDTVHIIKNISLANTLDIASDRELILDLNGYTLTTSANAPVINNSGLLTIIDSQGGGAINATTNNAITNNQNANLAVNSGVININVANYSAIDNYSTVTLGDTAVINVTNGYGIKNETTGDILDGSGTISGGIGIYNLSTTDSGFGGYNLVNSKLNNNTTHSLTLNDISGTGIINNQSTGNLTIIDSTFNKLYPTGDVNGGNAAKNNSIYVDNCTGDIDNGVQASWNQSNNKSYVYVRNGSDIGTINLYTGHLRVNDSEVSSINSYVHYDGTIIIDDSTIGFIKNNLSTMTIKGDTVVTGGMKNSSTLIIGEDDGIISSYPRISGTPIGIDGSKYWELYNSDTVRYGEISFYDGSITGNTGNVTENTIVSIPTGTGIVDTINNDRETYSIGQPEIAEVNGVRYSSIKAAVDSISTNTETEVTLINNAFEMEGITIPAGRNIKINFNDHDAHIYTADSWITNNGTLKLYNTDSISLTNSNVFITNTGTLNYHDITLNGSSKPTISNSGTFNMNSGYLRNVTINNTGTFIVNDGRITIPQTYNHILNSNVFTVYGGEIEVYKNYSTSIPINNSGSMTFNGGTLVAYNTTGYNNTILYAIDNNNSGILTINAGTFKTTRGTPSSNYTANNFAITNTATTYIYGGEFPGERIVDNKSGYTTLIQGFTPTNCPYVGYNYGTMTIKDSTINNTTIVNQGSGILTLDGTDLTSATYQLTNYGTATIKDSTITTTTNATSISGAAIYLTGTNSTTTIENSVIKNLGRYYFGCITMEGSSNLTVKSGSVISTQGTAIYNATSNGVITIGELGGNVSQTSPKIDGMLNGIYNLKNSSIAATLNFYDGIITGYNGDYVGQASQTINGGPSAIETGYEIITIPASNGRESKYLSNDTLAENTTTHETYSDLATAISEASSGDTIKFLRDLTTLTTITSEEIPAGKSITIDMNGHDIANNGTNVPFMINNGTLTFIDSVHANDSTKSGKVINHGTQSFVTNNGTLNITYLAGNNMTSGSIINNTASNTVTITDFQFSTEEANTAIINDGTMIINGGYITGTAGYTDSVAKISNSGTLTINELTMDYSNPKISNSGTLFIKGAYSYSRSYSGDIINTGTTTITGENSVNIGGIRNNGSGVVNISDSSVGPITGAASSITNISSGTVGRILTNGQLNITGGTVTSSASPTIDLDDTGVLVLGTKDGTVNSSNPSIVSTSGAAIEGYNISFYDGKATFTPTFNNTLPIKGIIKDVETGYNAIISSNSEYLTSSPIVENTSTSQGYTSLDGAFSAAGNNTTIRALENFVLIDTVATVSNASGKTITFDTNGKNIYSTSGVMFENSGTLNITGSGSIRSITGTFMSNLGTLNINNGSIYSDTDNTGTMTINAGTIEGNITNNSSSSLTINDGTISNNISNSGSMLIEDGTLTDSASVTNNSTGTIVINDVSWTDTSSIGPLTNNGTVTINGGTFTVERLMGNSSSATATVDGGEFSNEIVNNYGTITIGNVTTNKIGTNRGTMTISGANISSLTDTIYNIGTNTTLNINNSTIATTNNIKMIDVQNGTLNIDSSTLTKNNSESNELIRILEGASAVIKGNTTITSLSTAINNNGTLTVGEKDENYIMSNPLIRGTTGINNTNVFNFYDGTMSGSETSIYGTVNDVEVNYVVDINTVDDYINATLKIPGENERVIIFNNINYSSLQAAINDAPTGTSTMVLYTNYDLTDNIVVPSGKTINFYTTDKTLNYNGYSITGAGTFNVISGNPPSASISKFISDTIASNIQLIILFFALIAITVLVIVYHKKKKANN